MEELANSHGYASAIVRALNLDSPRDAVAGVKDVVIKELTELDHAVHVRATEYFNHTFAPDLVLSWARDSEVERCVYLRFTEDAEYLTSGLSRIGDDRPLIFGLIPPATDGQAVHIGEQEDIRNALITDSVALEALIESKASDPVLGLMSNAIVQGGRGFFDAEGAASIARAVSQGFQGAKDLSATTTETATDVVDKFLDTKQADRMTSFLQAVWVGSGGRADLFPGRTARSGDLSAEGLEFLLNFEMIEDLDFWHRLGRGLSISQIAELVIEAPSPNLHRLIQANLDALWARGCAVVPAEQMRFGDALYSFKITEESGVMAFSWLVVNGFLALQGPGFIAYLSEQAEQARQSFQGAPHTGISVELLRRRAAGMRLNSLRLADEDDALVFDSNNVVQDDRLANLVSTFSTQARVQAAQVVLDSGQNLSLDFRQNIAAAITSSKPLMREMIAAAVSVFHSLSADQRTALEALLSVPEELRDHGQQSLF